MEFFGSGGTTQLKTLEDWRQHAPPISDDRWVDGRSAKELARDWLEGDAVERVVALLARHQTLTGLELERGIAEKETRFDAIRRGPRHHDLLVQARTSAGPVVIGVEGKADESFDLALDAWLARAHAGSSATQAPERLDRLTRAFFGTTLGEDPLLGTIRYQLLSALAGTLADAREQGAATAVLLVHEFDTDKTTKKLHERNAADLDAFVGRLMPERRAHGRRARVGGGPGHDRGRRRVAAGDGRRVRRQARNAAGRLMGLAAGIDLRVFVPLSPPAATGRRPRPRKRTAPPRSRARRRSARRTSGRRTRTRST